MASEPVWLRTRAASSFPAVATLVAPSFQSKASSLAIQFALEWVYNHPMIPAYRKFPLRTEYLSFRRLAKQLITPHLRIHYSRVTPRESGARLIVIVPKKVSKLATTRNHLKRLTYNTLWPLIQNQQLDVVVIYKPLAFKKSLSTTQALISELASYVSAIS